MNIKNILTMVGISAILLSTSCASTQDYERQSADLTRPAMRQARDITPEQVISQMKIRLNLTEEQITQIRPIIEDSMNQQKELFQEYRNQGPQAMASLEAKMQQLEQDIKERLAEFVTDAQLEEYQKMLEEQKVQRENMRPGGRGHPRGDFGQF
jgi:Spy/CpxP family protein refolding chaperone